MDNKIEGGEQTTEATFSSPAAATASSGAGNPASTTATSTSVAPSPSSSSYTGDSSSSSSDEEDGDDDGTKSIRSCNSSRSSTDNAVGLDQVVVIRDFPSTMDRVSYGQKVHKDKAEDLHVVVKETPKLKIYYVNTMPTPNSVLYGSAVECGDVFMSVNDVSVVGPSGQEINVAMTKDKTSLSLRMLRGKPLQKPLFAAEHIGKKEATKNRQYPFLVEQAIAQDASGNHVANILVLSGIASVSCTKYEFLGQEGNSDDAFPKIGDILLAVDGTLVLNWSAESFYELLSGKLMISERVNCIYARSSNLSRVPKGNMSTSNIVTSRAVTSAPLNLQPQSMFQRVSSSSTPATRVLRPPAPSFQSSLLVAPGRSVAVRHNFGSITEALNVSYVAMLLQKHRIGDFGKDRAVDCWRYDVAGDAGSIRDVNTLRDCSLWKDAFQQERFNRRLRVLRDLKAKTLKKISVVTDYISHSSEKLGLQPPNDSLNLLNSQLQHLFNRSKNFLTACRSDSDQSPRSSGKLSTKEKTMLVTRSAQARRGLMMSIQRRLKDRLSRKSRNATSNETETSSKLKDDRAVGKEKSFLQMLGGRWFVNPSPRISDAIPALVTWPDIAFARLKPSIYHSSTASPESRLKSKVLRDIPDTILKFFTEDSARGDWFFTSKGTGHHVMRSLIGLEEHTIDGDEDYREMSRWTARLEGLYPTLYISAAGLAACMRIRLNPSVTAVLLGSGYAFSFLPGPNCHLLSYPKRYTQDVTYFCEQIWPALTGYPVQPPNTRIYLHAQDTWFSVCHHCGAFVNKKSVIGEPIGQDTRLLCSFCSIDGLIEGLLRAQALQLVASLICGAVMVIAEELSRLFHLVRNNEYDQRAAWILPDWFRAFLIQAEMHSFNALASVDGTSTSFDALRASVETTTDSWNEVKAKYHVGSGEDPGGVDLTKLWDILKSKCGLKDDIDQRSFLEWMKPCASRVNPNTCLHELFSTFERMNSNFGALDKGNTIDRVHVPLLTVLPPEEIVASAGDYLRYVPLAAAVLCVLPRSLQTQLLRGSVRDLGRIFGLTEDDADDILECSNSVQVPKIRSDSKRAEAKGSITLPPFSLWHTWDIRSISRTLDDLIGAEESLVSPRFVVHALPRKTTCLMMQLYVMSSRTISSIAGQYSPLRKGLPLRDSSDSFAHGTFMGMKLGETMYAVDIAQRLSKRARERFLLEKIKQYGSPSKSALELADSITDSAVPMLSKETTRADVKSVLECSSAPVRANSTGPEASTSSKSVFLVDAFVDILKNEAERQGRGLTGEERSLLRTALSAEFVEGRKRRSSYERMVTRLAKTVTSFCQNTGVPAPTKPYSTPEQLSINFGDFVHDRSRCAPPVTGTPSDNSSATSGSNPEASIFAVGNDCVPTIRELTRYRRWNFRNVSQMLSSCSFDSNFGLLGAPSERQLKGFSWHAPLQKSSVEPSPMFSSSDDITVALAHFFSADSVAKDAAWPYEVATAISRNSGSSQDPSDSSDDNPSAPDPFSVASQLIRLVDSLSGAGRHAYRWHRYLVPPPRGALDSGTIHLKPGTSASLIERDDDEFENFGFGDKPLCSERVASRATIPSFLKISTSIVAENGDVVSAKSREETELSRLDGRIRSMLSHYGFELSEEKLQQAMNTVWKCRFNCPPGWWQDSRNNEDSEDRECESPACTQRAKLFSKFCSARCGFITASLRLAAATRSANTVSEQRVVEKNGSKTPAPVVGRVTHVGTPTPSTTDDHLLTTMEELKRRLTTLQKMRDILNEHFLSLSNREAVQPLLSDSISDERFADVDGYSNILDTPWNTRRTPRVNRYMLDVLDVADAVSEVGARKRMRRSVTSNKKRPRRTAASSRQRKRRKKDDESESGSESDSESVVSETTSKNGTKDGHSTSQRSSKSEKSLGTIKRPVAKDPSSVQYVDHSFSYRAWLREHYHVLYTSGTLESGMNGLQSRISLEDAYSLPNEAHLPCVDIPDRSWLCQDVMRSDVTKKFIPCGFPTMAALKGALGGDSRDGYFKHSSEVHVNTSPQGNSLNPHTSMMTQLAELASERGDSKAMDGSAEVSQSKLAELLAYDSNICMIRRGECLAHASWDQTVSRQIEVEERRLATQLEAIAVDVLRRRSIVEGQL
eukprot:gb/GECG01005255.1/.p1 GENE.gb/GECG01005255.1/~~gb/GECG01005255.1/.p1  ORF type:complete len:2131 (+),score=241.81 gb/GECG01005255.1/:1-6393(+)